jgi:hypothetical protein
VTAYELSTFTSDFGAFTYILRIITSADRAVSATVISVPPSRKILSWNVLAKNTV